MDIFRVILHVTNDGAYNSRFEFNLRFIPRKGDSIIIGEFIGEEETQKIIESSKRWSGESADILIVDIGIDNKGYYHKLFISCEE